MKQLNPEDFFSFCNSEASFSQTCDICNNVIPEHTKYKSNAAWKRIESLKMCNACFEKKDTLISQKMIEIESSMKSQVLNFNNALVRVAIQNCCDLSSGRIFQRLRTLKNHVNFEFKIHESESFHSSKWHRFPSCISFSVMDESDFKRKFALINKHCRTPCGCGLFIGDGCIPEACIITRAKTIDIEFNFLDWD